MSPHVVEHSAVAADHVHRTHKTIDPETGCQHEHIEFVQLPVDGAHAAWLDALDAFGDQFGVGLLDRRIKVARDDEALTRSSIVGPQLFAQHRVVHAVFEVCLTYRLNELHLRRIGIDHSIRKPVGEAARDFVAHHRDDLGMRLELLDLGFGEGGIFLWTNPLRRALKHGDRADPIDKRCNDLHRRRTRANHANATTIERHAVVPARAVKRCPSERLDAIEVRNVGMVQHAGSRNDHVDGVGATVGGGEVPSAVHELGLIDCSAKHDALRDCVPLRDTLEVRLDFGTRGIAMAPLGVGLKRVAIEV